MVESLVFISVKINQQKKREVKKQLLTRGIQRREESKSGKKKSDTRIKPTENRVQSPGQDAAPAPAQAPPCMAPDDTAPDPPVNKGV